VLEMARTGRVAMARGASAGVQIAPIQRPLDSPLEFDSGVSFSV